MKYQINYLNKYNINGLDIALNFNYYKIYNYYSI